jgi:hypothetical protein
MAGCFGCFQFDRHPKASAAAPIFHQSRTPSSQVADISHLLGTDGHGRKPKEVSKLMSMVQIPQHGQFAFEEVGHLGDAQQRTLKLMRHRRSKELAAVKFIKQSAGNLLASWNISSFIQRSQFVGLRCLQDMNKLKNCMGADTLLDKNVEREILNHRQLVHPNILAFREVFTTESDVAIVVRGQSPSPSCITETSQPVSNGSAMLP